MSPCLLIEFYFRLLPHTSARVDFQPFFNLHIKTKARNILIGFSSTTNFKIGGPNASASIASTQLLRLPLELYSFKCVSVTIKDLFLCKHWRGVAGYSATIKGVATGKSLGTTGLITIS